MLLELNLHDRLLKGALPEELVEQLVSKGWSEQHAEKEVRRIDDAIQEEANKSVSSRRPQLTPRDSVALLRVAEQRVWMAVALAAGFAFVFGERVHTGMSLRASGLGFSLLWVAWGLRKVRAHGGQPCAWRWQRQPLP